MMERWVKEQLAILKEIYWYGQNAVMMKRIQRAKQRAKKKRLQHTFGAGKLEDIKPKKIVRKKWTN